MTVKYHCLLIILSMCCLGIHAQSVRINEIVSSNSTNFDEDGDAPDWIELHNYGTTPVSLLDWGLTDDEDDLHDWQFPDITLAPDEYMLVWASDKDRTALSFARTLINQGDVHSYLVPNAEPSANWNSQTFDDSSWESGPSGFGYGDGDDATEIAEGSISVYTRTSFGVGDLSSLNSLILDIDYDDGFVAYINGTEVARANIEGIPPSFDATTNDYIDEQIINGGTPERFVIDMENIDLNEDGNVLAIQLHNFDEDSSDLTLIPFLSGIYAEDIAFGITPPEVLSLRDGKLHTNFRISSSSEDLYLSDAEENIVDHVLVENLASDTSFGVSITSGELVNYLDTTPGAVNSSIEFTGIVSSELVFSNEGGPVSDPVSLSITGNTAEETIHYTTDATLPTEEDPEYTDPILITENTVIRARVFRPNYIPSEIYSKSFVFNSAHEIDMFFLTTEPENFFDEETGIYVFGPEGTYQTNFPYYDANFWEDWERPIHMAYYETGSDTPAVEYNAGVQIFGGFSRGHAQKSLSLFARGQYGASEFEYPFFDELEYDTFEALVLRNSGNDWLSSCIKDIALTSLMRGSGLDFQEHRPVATYLNGEYWGMYNLREKTNEHMLASKHNVDADDITMLEKDAEVIEGSNDEYLELIDYVSSTDLSVDANFEYVSDRVDVMNYALYQSSNIFFNNTDWPGNNIKFWKHPEGKWRWILFDTDFGFGPPWNTANYEENTLSFALEEGGTEWPNPDWSTLLFRNLLTNINFRNLFVNRYADELNTRFLPDHVKEHIDTIYASVVSEIPAYFERWDDDENALSFVNAMKKFAEERPDEAKEHILTTLELPAMHTVTITNTDPALGFVRLNDNLKIQESTWSGDYFETVPVILTAVAETGYEFSHWSGDVDATEKTITVNLVDATNVTPNFIVSTTEAIVINEINHSAGDDFDTDDWIELYNPNDDAIDISNWQLKDDDDTHVFNIPSGTQIAANAYIVLVRSESDFSEVFPSVTNIVGEIDFGFGSEDAVRLYNDQGILQDQVIYDELWPICADGTGQTLELTNAALDNGISENWACINTLGSPDSDNNDFTLSIEEVASNSAIKIFPNPVSETLHLEGITNFDAIQVFNITGQEVISEEHKTSNSIDVKELQEGFYILRIKDKELNESVYQFIKK